MAVNIIKDLCNDLKIFILLLIEVSLFYILKTLNFRFQNSYEQRSVRNKSKNSELAAYDVEKIKLDPDQPIPRSVNYHFTRKCNYECGFCFHTAKTSFMLNLEDAKRGLRMLKGAGMEKVNFSGGEPFLPECGRHLGEMVKYCKMELKLPSVTIVTNGSMVREKWFLKYGQYLDIMAVSCDSFNEDTNKAIGRGQKGKNHIEQLMKIRDWCNNHNVLFKINTVVNTYNCHENMVEEIENLSPVRWKVFQCLLLEGENAGPDALRNAEQFYINSEIFEQFLEQHKNVQCLVPESNTKMQNSYLILDEYNYCQHFIHDCTIIAAAGNLQLCPCRSSDCVMKMSCAIVDETSALTQLFIYITITQMRFLDCRKGSKIPSKSILDVGVANALQFSGFDEVMFKKRGGVYKWSKVANQLSW